MRKIVSIVAVLALLLGISTSAWAVSQNFPSTVTFQAPPGASMSITYWTGRSATGNQINFSLGATGIPTLGRTSWEDGDGFTSLDANVGFTATCVGPSGSRLGVACGKMTDGSGHEIPYESPDGLTDYFGFSARIETGGYVAGSPTSMQIHSLAGWSYTFGADEYGHDFAILNLLKIPTSAVPGTYNTNGSGNYQHLMLTFV